MKEFVLSCVLLATFVAVGMFEKSTEELAELNYNRAVCHGEFYDYHDLKPDCSKY